jgi:hypothetical protein
MYLVDNSSDVPYGLPYPYLVEFLPFVGVEPYTMGFKYMFNLFPLPIGLLNILSSIPTENKNYTREGVEKVVRYNIEIVY